MRLAIVFALSLFALACDAGPPATPAAATPGAKPAANPAANPAAAAAPMAAAGAPVAGIAPGTPAGAGAAQGAAWAAYGADMNDERPVLSAANLLADPAQYDGQTVRVEGRVADVCQKKGCWMVLADGDKSIRVTMRDHDFAVDMQGAGQDCQVDGVVVGKPRDPDTIAHYESESKGGAVVPEKQVQGDVVYELVATAVRMRPAS